MPDRILVPMDDSEQASKALAEAADAFPDATITVLHVARMPTRNVDELQVIAGGNWEKYRTQRADVAFERAKDVATKHGVEIETKVVDGEVARTIVEHAAEYDWVVIGSHGRDGVARILLGSVAERVVRRAPVPVTVVR